MRSATYSMGVSLDGFIVGPDGDFNWTAPPKKIGGATLAAEAAALGLIDDLRYRVAR